MCIHHGQFFSVAGRNTFDWTLSQITLITHEHDGNVIIGNILPRRRKLLCCKSEKWLYDWWHNVVRNNNQIHISKKQSQVHDSKVRVKQCFYVQHLHFCCMKKEGNKQNYLNWMCDSWIKALNIFNFSWLTYVVWFGELIRKAEQFITSIMSTHSLTLRKLFSLLTS